MKRILAAILILATVLSLAACGGENGSTGPETEPAEYSVSAAGPAIISRIRQNYKNNAHPRLMMTADRFAFVKSHAGDATVVGKEYKYLEKKAAYYLTTEEQRYILYDRLRLLQVSRALLSVVYTCAFAYNVSGEEKYAERAARELDSAASFPGWNSRHFLDVGEMCAAFGIGYDWLYGYLSEERRALYREKILAFGFEPALDDYLDRPRERTYDWYHDTPGDNWKLVCNGGLGLAAMAICDEPGAAEICESILSYGYESSYQFIRDAYLELDGSYSEGLMYWSYATQYLAYYASALETACGTDFDLTDWAGLKKTGYFPCMMSSNNFTSFNYGDAYETDMSDWALLWLGHEFDSGDFYEFRLKTIRANSYDVHDLLFLYEEQNGGDAAQPDLPLDFGSVGGVNATFRTGWTGDDLFAGIHFGKNDEYHGHSDMGQFVIEYQNRRFFSDLGADDYNLPGYESIYRHVAEGHNTLIINRGDKATDQLSAGETYISRYKSEGSEAFALADMTSAYNARSVVRGMKLLRDAKTVILQDEIRAEDPSDDIYWFGHTKADLTVSEDGREASLTIRKVTVKAVLLGDGVFTVLPAETTEWSENQTGGQGVNEGFKRLTVNLTGKTDYTICVAFFPEDGSGEIPAPVPLEDWA